MTTFSIGKSENSPLKIDLSRLVDTRLLIQANSGGGKSWLMRLLVERAASKVQIIILDPEGEFATLREKVDIALVGRDGELATDLRSSAMLAKKLVEHHISAVVDLYDLRLDQRRAYVRTFLESLMSVSRTHWHPLLVMLDEAHIFAPERSTGEAESTQAVIALMSQGRKRGFAGILATQRLSKLHKDAAAESNNVMIGRTWLDVDQQRAGDLLGMNKADRQALRDLSPGEFYAFGPALNRGGVVRFNSDEVATTHPKAGQRHTLTVPQASMAIKEIVEQIGDLPAQAEEEARTVADLQKKNSELKRQLSARPIQMVPEKIIERIEVPVLNGEDKRLEVAVNQMMEFSTIIRDAAGDISNAMRAFASRPAPMPVRLPALARTPIAPRAALAPRLDQNQDLPRGERAILEALIQYPDGLRREQLTVLTGYKRSSRDAYIQRLREKGYVLANSDNVSATNEGISALPNAQPLPTGQALRDFWQSRLPQGERVIFDALVSAYPESVDRNSLEEATGYKRSSRDAYLQRLSAKELVSDVGRGFVRASQSLFE